MKFTGSAIERNNKGAGFFLLCTVAAAGILTGAVCVSQGHSFDSPWVHQYFSPLSFSGSLSGYFIRGLLASDIFLISAFVFGLSAIGQPFSVFLLFYRGFGFGVSAAAIYDLLGFGAFSTVLLLIPKAFLILLVSAVAVRESVLSSGFFLRCLLQKNIDENGENSLRLYFTRFFVLLFIFLIILTGDVLLNIISA